MFKMAKTVLKNLVSKPPTRKYPYVVREPFKGERGRIENDIDTCILCGICSKQCPVGAITVNKDENYWEIDRFKCITCNYCAEKCPKKSLAMKEERAQAAYEKSTHRDVKQEKATAE